MPPPPHPPCPVREGGGGQQEAGPGDGCGERALFLEIARALFLVKQNYSYLGLFDFFLDLFLGQRPLKILTRFTILFNRKKEPFWNGAFWDCLGSGWLVWGCHCISPRAQGLGRAEAPCGGHPQGDLVSWPFAGRGKGSMHLISKWSLLGHWEWVGSVTGWVREVPEEQACEVASPAAASCFGASWDGPIL